ncbi:TrbL/VirB6 family protein [Lysobacter fragariae]
MISSATADAKDARGNVVVEWLNGGDWKDWMGFQGQEGSLGDFLFFQLIFDYLRVEIQDFGFQMMARAMKWAGGVAFTVMWLWILIQGYRIVTGQSRESMMALVTQSLRATFIIGVAATMGVYGTQLKTYLTDDLRQEINYVVTGHDELPETRIDQNLAWMQVALSAIDVVDVASDPNLDSAKTRAMWFAGIGAGGPAIVAGITLLMYEVAMALFIGLGPIFILSLLFEQTKPLFGRWLYYGLGTMFSMSVLSAMISISLELMLRVAPAFWAGSLADKLMGPDYSDGLTSVAMQQGGLGVILSALILSAPPMAAMFFQGTLGNYSGGNAFARPDAAPKPQPAGGMPPWIEREQKVSPPQFLGPMAGVPAEGAATGQRGIAARIPTIA